LDESLIDCSVALEEKVVSAWLNDFWSGKYPGLVLEVSPRRDLPVARPVYDRRLEPKPEPTPEPKLQGEGKPGSLTANGILASVVLAVAGGLVGLGFSQWWSGAAFCAGIGMAIIPLTVYGVSLYRILRKEDLV
jgi:hypothetical protein